MQLVQRVRRLFSRSSDEEKERRRIAKAQMEAAMIAERARIEGSNTSGFGG